MPKRHQNGMNYCLELLWGEAVCLLDAMLRGTDLKSLTPAQARA